MLQKAVITKTWACSVVIEIYEKKNNLFLVALP